MGPRSQQALLDVCLRRRGGGGGADVTSRLQPPNVDYIRHALRHEMPTDDGHPCTAQQFLIGSWCH